jgi:nucleotide-binding universal stress UspA family protein
LSWWTAKGCCREIGGTWSQPVPGNSARNPAERRCGALQTPDDRACVLAAVTIGDVPALSQRLLIAATHAGKRDNKMISVPADKSPIVVGVDGSPASLAALRWAVQDATAHAAPLWAVHVLDPRERRASYARPATPVEDPTDAVALAEELIERDAPAPVRRIFEVGPPARMLLRHCAEARILVLGHDNGHRRPGGDQALDLPALGPTARACMQSAPCPVIVVPLSARDPAENPQPAQPPVNATCSPQGEAQRTNFPSNARAPLPAPTAI